MKAVENSIDRCAISDNESPSVTQSKMTMNAKRIFCNFREFNSGVSLYQIFFYSKEELEKQNAVENVTLTIHNYMEGSESATIK